jgi:hypothetical protein
MGILYMLPDNMEEEKHKKIRRGLEINGINKGTYAYLY